MDRVPLEIPLTSEQQYVLGELIENGKIVELAGHRYLMTPVSPMSIEFLQAIRLRNRKNKLFTRTPSSHWTEMFNKDLVDHPEPHLTLADGLEAFELDRQGSCPHRGGHSGGSGRGP